MMLHKRGKLIKTIFAFRKTGHEITWIKMRANESKKQDKIYLISILNIEDINLNENIFARA